MNHNNLDILYRELPNTLVNKASSCDRLRFASIVVPWKFKDAVDESAESWEGLRFCQERMAEAVKTIEFSLGVAQIEFKMAFINQLKNKISEINIKPDMYNNPKLCSPIWLKDYFDEIFRNDRYGCFIEEVQAAQFRGEKIVYWESGFNGDIPTYTIIDFPTLMSSSVIEVFWGLVNNFDAPSYLTPITETSWLVRHVEE